MSTRGSESHHALRRGGNEQHLPASRGEPPVARANAPGSPLRLPRLPLLLLLPLLPIAACENEPEPLTNPRAISVVSPFRYPTELWDEGAEGETVVMVHVTDLGAVDSVYVLESSGRTAFDSAAVRGARELRFTPGRRGDRRVAMWARLPVRFNRSDTTNTGAMP